MGLAEAGARGPPTVLFVTAHPDDETMFFAPAITRHVAQLIYAQKPEWHWEDIRTIHLTAGLGHCLEPLRAGCGRKAAESTSFV